MNSVSHLLATDAKQVFGDVSDAELRFLEKAPLGCDVECSPAANPLDAKDPLNNPAYAATWATDRNIRSALIRWVCIHHADRIDPKGIRIRAAQIIGTLDLCVRGVRIRKDAPCTAWLCTLAATRTPEPVQAILFFPQRQPCRPSSSVYHSFSRRLQERLMLTD